MRGKQWLAWILVLSLAASLALSALAAPAEEIRPSDQALVARESETDPGVAESDPGSEENAKAGAEEPTLAGPDDGGAREPDAIDEPVTEEARKDAEKLEKLIESVTTEPDALKSIGFGEVESRMRSRNLQILSFQESIDYLSNLNYTYLSDSLRKQLNDMSEGQFRSINPALLVDPTSAVTTAAMIAQVTAQGTYAAMQTSQIYSNLRTQFDDIKDGKTQTETAGAIRQLRNYQDQIVMGGESLYITLAGLEAQRAALKRQLSALDRTVEEMELRKELGQISDLQLREIKGGRSKLESGIETVDMNLQTLKYQLENLLGAGLTGTIALGGVPVVSEKELSAMDEEKDLAAAKAKSYELYAAGKTLETARKTFRDYKGSTAETNPAYRKVLSEWNAAQNTYNAALRSYELKFRTLYSQVKDYYQVWKNAQAALEDQRASYKASELKQSQGNLSWNALLSARDEVSGAEDAVRAAANDLFSSYNTYRWAVEHGILN